MVKHVAICLTLVMKMMKVDSKLMKVVLNCAKFELNADIGNTKAKVDSKQIELRLNYDKSKPNQAIGDAKAKLDTKLK
jgi:hypothetical protein